MSPQFVFYFQSSVVGQRRDVWLSHWEVKILKRRKVGYFLILIHDHNHHIQSNSIVICLNLEKNRFLSPPPPPHPFLLLFFFFYFFHLCKINRTRSIEVTYGAAHDKHRRKWLRGTVQNCIVLQWILNVGDEEALFFLRPVSNYVLLEFSRQPQHVVSSSLR